MSGLIPSDFGDEFDSSDFEVAGYLPLGSGFDDGYVDTEGQDNPDIDWQDMDYVVVHDTDLDIYFTLIGPWEDEDAFYEDVAEWYEEGS